MNWLVVQSHFKRLVWRLLIIVLALLGVKSLIIDLGRAEGRSMEPFINDNQYFLVVKLPLLWSEPEVGDVVQLLVPDSNELLVKRVTAKPSEDEYYVIGDNLAQSRDSRDFGTIKRTKILGKVLPF